MALPKFTTLLRLAVNFTSRRDFAVFWCGVEVVAMLWSRFLVSVAMIALAIIATCELRWISRPRLLLPPQYLSRLKDFFNLSKHFDWWSISILFWLMLLSGLWSEDLGYWFNRSKLYLPFFILPLIFYLLPNFNKKNYFAILYFNVIALSLLSLGILGNYFFHFSSINEGLLRGQPIPTPRSHINFNFSLVFAFFCSIELLKHKIYWRRSTQNLSMPPYALVIGISERPPEWELPIQKKQLILMSIIAIFLWLTVHILAVRGGLLTLYMVLLYQILSLIIQQKQWRLGLLALGFFVFTIWAAWQTVPSIQNRIRFMRWDLSQWQEKKYMNNSDAERVVSISIGLELLSKSPYLGIGAGDVKQETVKIYEEKYPTLIPKIPHSQFLLIAVATGFIGLLLFLGVYLWSFWHFRKDTFYISILLIYFIPFFFDILPETSFGVLLFSFFASLKIKERFA